MRCNQPSLRPRPPGRERQRPGLELPDLVAADGRANVSDRSPHPASDVAKKRERPGVSLGRSSLGPGGWPGYGPTLSRGRFAAARTQWTEIGTFLLANPFGAFIVTSSTPSW
jgi:hypothetical protein